MYLVIYRYIWIHMYNETEINAWKCINICIFVYLKISLGTKGICSLEIENEKKPLKEFITKHTKKMFSVYRNA